MPAPIEPVPQRTQAGTFVEKFCARYGVAPASYEKEMLRRCLYPTGRLLYALSGREARYFSPDRDFIQGVGRITRTQEYEEEAAAFTNDPDNRRFTRRYLKCRVSAGKLHAVLTAVLEPQQRARKTGDSVPPC